MPLGPPVRHVGSNLRDQAQCGVGTDTVQLAQVRVDQSIEDCAYVELRFVGATVSSMPWRRKRWRGGRHLGRLLGQAGFDLDIASLDLQLQGIK